MMHCNTTSVPSSHCNTTCALVTPHLHHISIPSTLHLDQVNHPFKTWHLAPCSTFVTPHLYHMISWLPNQIISLIFGSLCRSSSWRLWSQICGGRLFWPLLRPQMVVFDHFFLQNMFLMGMTKEGFFWGSCRSFFGPWERFSKNEGGFPKRRGDFMLWSIFLMWCYETCLQSNIKTKNK